MIDVPYISSLCALMSGAPWQSGLAHNAGRSGVPPLTSSGGRRGTLAVSVLVSFASVQHRPRNTKANPIAQVTDGTDLL